jgi:hypothetical protein
MLEVGSAYQYVVRSRFPRLEDDWDALDPAHVKLGRPNATADVVKPGSKTVWSTLPNDTPRGGGAIESGIDTLLARRDGVVTPW